jgi:hypothetical protein
VRRKKLDLGRVGFFRSREVCLPAAGEFGPAAMGGFDRTTQAPVSLAAAPTGR